jgi:hypothetical protein
LFPLRLAVLVLCFERGIDLLRCAVDLVLASLRCRSNPTFCGVATQSVRAWLLLLASLLPLASCGERSGQVRGRVLDLGGRPLAGVQVRHGAEVSHSDSTGSFLVRDVLAPGWIDLRRNGFFPALRPVEPNRSIVVRLSPDDGQTIVLRAVGDVMAGRRFLSGHAETDQPPQVLPGDGMVPHQRLLAAMQPILEQADLTVVNLESPLLLDPVSERMGFRKPGFHASKDYVFASSSSLGAALARVGVDVVGLANNHIYDALDHGLVSTVQALDLAGFVRGAGVFGAGATPEQAWQPARQWLRGTVVSLVGCTTVHGSQYPNSYVTSVNQHKGGAALCELSRLVTAIQVSRQRGPVVAMIHGGTEFQSEPSPPIRHMTDAALQAGARLVLNHHPHVLGGLRWTGQSLVANSLGNFLFDQTYWHTFPSMVLEAQLRRDGVRRVIVYPLLLHRYRPHPAVGPLADWILRGIASKSDAPWVIESGVLEVDVAARAQRTPRWWPLKSASDASPRLWRLQAAVQRCGWRGLDALEHGQSLLGTGSFEPHLVGVDAGRGVLWRSPHRDQQLVSQAAFRGSWGVRLKRAGYNRQPVLLSPLHRIPVRPGQRLTLVGWVRGSSRATARVQVSWYQARRGPSVARVSHPIVLKQAQRWQPLHVELTVPDHVNALAPAIALDPPSIGWQQQLDVDELDLVAWQPSSAVSSQPADWLRSRGGGEICLQQPLWPGASPTPAPLAAWP